MNFLKIILDKQKYGATMFFPEGFWIVLFSINIFFHNQVHVPDPKTHYENIVGVKTWASKKELESLRDEPKRDIWLTQPAIVNAFYSPNHNSISKCRVGYRE